MAISQNSTYTPTQGSGKWAAYEVNSTGCRIGTAFAMPWISGSTLTKEVAVNERPTEGSNVFTSDGTTTATFTATGMQTDKDSIDFVQSNGGKYYVICKEIRDVALGGFYDYYIMPKAKLNKSFTHTAPGGEIEYSFSLEDPGSSYSSVTLSQFTTSTGLTTSLTGTYAPASGEYFTIKQSNA